MVEKPTTLKPLAGGTVVGRAGKLAWGKIP